MLFGRKKCSNASIYPYLRGAGRFELTELLTEMRINKIREGTE